MIRIRALAATAMVVTALSIAACGGDDGYGDSSSPTKAPDATQPAAAAAGPAVKIGNSVKFGSYLTTGDGLTLYTFAQDSAGKSACSGSCAATWPPLTTTSTTLPAVEGAPAAFSLITRDDGAKQIAYNGKPLYRYGPDKAPGDANGQGIGNVWFVATSAGAAGSPAAGAANGTPVATGDNPYGY